MARINYIPGAEPPVNDGERRVIEYLKQHLPEEFVLFPGVQVIHRDRTDDVDVLILTPYALVIGEIKDIAGDFVIDNGACYVNDNLRPQPFNVTNAKARRLKSRLQDADPQLRGVWVSPLVILAREPESLSLNPPILNESVMMLDRSVEKLTTPSRLVPGNNPRELGDLKAGVERVLGLLQVRERDVRFGAYTCTELLDRTSDEDVWSAQHAITGKEVEIRHIGRNPATKDRRVREAEGELAAFEELRSSPQIDGPTEVLPQDDGSIALVYPPRQGTSLADLLDADEELPASRIILDVATAIADAHEAGISHGRLSPRWIEVLPDTVKVRGFSLVRREGVPAATQLIEADQTFLAPEVVARQTSGAPADIYALGKLIELLQPDDPVLQRLSAELTKDDIADRAIPADYLRRVLAGALGGMEPTDEASLPDPTTGTSALPDRIDVNEDGHLIPGSVIGSNTVMGHLGSGGFSDVYRAQHFLGGPHRAVKVFKEEDAESFVKLEFNAIQRIHSPNVVKVLDAGHSELGWYLVSEYLEGTLLDQIIDHAADSPDSGEAVLIAYELLHALRNIHGAGITHRDVKPANIILVEERGPVLFDFGVSATPSRQVAGLSWAYWPPDLPAGAEGPDPDLFALGVVLHELLTGTHPYPHGNTQAGAAPELSRLGPGLRDVVGKAVNPDMNERFSSADEFLTALEPYVDISGDITIPPQGLYQRVERLISLGKLDEAERLCRPDWMRLRRRIQRGRASTGEIVAGLSVRFTGEGSDQVHALDGSGLVDATTWTYEVNGETGLMIDIRITEDANGGVQVATVNAYDSTERVQQLENRLRHGVYPADSGYVMRLRSNSWSADGRLTKRQASSVDALGAEAGLDVNQLLLDAGALAIGKRRDIGLPDPAGSKSEVAVIVPEDKRNDIVLLAYLLTTVVPIARDLGLLIDPDQ